MILTESSDDFNRKYGRCFVKITSPLEGIFYIDHTDGRFLMGRFIQPRDDEVSIPLDEFESTFEYPDLGIINVNRNVIYGVRMAARQWRRSFSTGNDKVRFTTPLSWGIEDKLVNFATSNGVLRHIFYPKYFTPKQAWAKVSKGIRISAAINSNFFIGVNNQLPFIYVGYKDYCIGKATASEYILSPGAAHLYEELTNLTENAVTIGEIKG